MTRWLSAGAAAGTVVALSSCSSAATSANADAAKKVTFADSTPAAAGPLARAVWMLPKEPTSLDLTNDGANDESDVVMANVCERLNRLNPDLSVSPGLATKFEWRTKTSLVFTIRDNVTFHDGAPMTMDDVLWSLKRDAAPGNAENDEYVNVKSIDQTAPHEITFTMTQPDAVFVEALAGDAGVIQERKLVETEGKSFGTPSGKDGCTGPYALSQWQPGRSIVLEKAPNYWNAAAAAQTGTVTFQWASDDAVVNSLVTGAAQGAYLEDIALGVRLSQNNAVSVQQGPDTRSWSLMATDRGGLTNPAVRRALSLALDRDGINRAAFTGLGRPAREPVGSGAWGYERDTFAAAHDQLAGSPAAPAATDIAEARKLVASAGPTTPIVVASDGSSIRNVLANAVVDAAGKIGLKASIVQFPTAQYGDFYDNPDLRKKADLFADDYFVSKCDPIGFYKNGRSTSSVQWLLKDPAYDTLVQQGRAALDPRQRAKIAIELARRWNAAMPWISVMESPTTVAVSAKVTGVPSSGSYRYAAWAAALGTKG